MILLELDLDQAQDLMGFIEDLAKDYTAGRVPNSLQFIYGELMPQVEEEIYG